MATPRKRPEDKLKVGRPTGYRPEFCERIIELGKDGKTVAQIAREFDVSRSTVHLWREKFPEFSDAFTRARDLALAFWEDRGADGLGLAGFNAGLYSFLMRSWFVNDFAEKKELTVTGKDGAPLIPQCGVLVVPGMAASDDEWEKSANKAK